jgi:ferric-dicitrate binding protein FerR (iron transport regulator)
MSDRNNNLDERQRLAQDAVQSLPRPEAVADFRARLKAGFVAGDIPESDLSEPKVVELPEHRTRRGAWVGLAGGLAAAAVVAFILLGLAQLPGPELVATQGTGRVTIDGQDFAANDLGSLAEALEARSHILIGEGVTLDIVYPGSFAMRFTQGTDIVLPERPGRWFRRSVESPMYYGDISVRTGPDMAGGRIIVITDEARTEIHGTMVSIVRNEAVTCICLLDGLAEIITPLTELGPVPPGKRWVVFRDGSEPQLMDIMPPHQEHMEGLDESLGDILQKP